MSDEEGVWAVAYHGVRCPADPFGSKRVLNNIFKGRK